ncbi:leucine zipper putative tumor suppressor 1 [Paramormyrops kingsleyae]|uniref:leucine zipper putative tumor suppressor 1 n=1 Tax=Paramormyrops kingsleyae TaxID=1676925 RepID=UPI003B96AEE4
MGSVSSLISGHSFHTKHCRATEYKPKRTSQPKRAARNLDGLLRYGFSHEPTSNPSKASHPSEKNEDFLYIKVSQKPRTPHQRQLQTEEQLEGPADMEASSCTPPQLVPMSGKLDKGIEKSLIRPTAFKPVIPRSSSASESHNVCHMANKRHSPSDRGKDTNEQRLDANSGTLSDSGRNSMSSLPTHSTNGSSHMDNFPSAVGVLTHLGGSAHSLGHTQQLSSSLGSKGTNRTGSKPPPHPAGEGTSPEKQDMFSESAGGCMRSPISMDESLIELLEQRLLERENELQELQVSFEEKEADTCKLFQEKQRYCTEEMEGLKQRCSSQLRQVSQKALRAQQLLQLQVFQVQQEKQQLQEDLSQLTKEKDLMEVQLRTYESKQTQMTPTLEETQWEVCQKSGEISLLKQQLKDSQADVSNKLNEIVSLKATLKDTKIRMEALEQKIKEQEDAVRSKTVDLEVCKNELQRKKNEADLLRGKVGQLETDIQGMIQDMALAKELATGRGGIKSQPDIGEDVEALQRALEKLKEQLREERQQKEDMVSNFQLERQTWDGEKDKVIRYQKQLQYNYLQMHQRNQELEKVLRELTVELESRPEVDLDVQSADIHFEDIIATEI